MRSPKNNAIPIIQEQGKVDYYPNFLSTEIAEILYQQLLNGSNWKQYPIKMFGKTMLQPRLIAWYGDPNTAYTYSQTKLVASGWTPPLKRLYEEMSQQLGLNFNSVLMNLYRNGQDSMGWHSDDEASLGEQPVIASISLGTIRSIQFRLKANHQQKTKLALASGSLLLMQGDTQEFWQHQIAKTKRVDQARINLTFRTIVS